MNFQEFCDQEQEVDEQLVSIKNTFVIGFGKTDGTSFNIDPGDIAIFLKFLRDQHDVCRSVIETHPQYTADSYTQYQEKPYRALYKLTENDGRLNTIRSLGGSQTKELTKIISKLICFLANVTYTGIEKNTQFDKSIIDLALKNMPGDLKTLAANGSASPKALGTSMKDLFERWLREKGLSEKSIKNYAGSTINLIDSIIYGERGGQSIYSIRSPEAIKHIISTLLNDSLWQQKNRDGKEMWRTGINHYHSFLTELKVVTHLTKPFLLLAGISGTGKTRFVREQAREHDEDLNNFCLVPVRPDWHEPSDLLGYETQLSGTAQYIPTDVIKFIIRAWQVVAPQASKAGCGELDLSAVPYWLCLDEMNLAPVEQYFADYLSVLESREFRDGRYACDALITQEMLTRLDKADEKLKDNLGLEEGGLWQYFLANGIQLPPNLIVAGTVNMDETTHGFSRKVIDRAVTLDFGEFFPNDYDVFFNQTVEPVSFSWSVETHASLDGLAGGYDGDGNRSIEFLTAVNAVLKRTPFELAYRALNELLLLVASLKPASEIELQAVWDDFLMTKVLPRIEGDDDKLRCNGDSDSDKTTLLEELDELLADRLGLIWGNDRKDFYRVNSVSGDAESIPCRSLAKLRWMQDRLKANTFTSFWP